MSIIIGEDKIKSIYVGEQKIVKAYVGANLVFSAAPATLPFIPTLPAEYTEVEYIQIGANVEVAKMLTWGSMDSSSNFMIDFSVVNVPWSSSKNLLVNYAPALLESLNGSYIRAGIFLGNVDGVPCVCGNSIAGSNVNIKIQQDF